LAKVVLKDVYKSFTSRTGEKIAPEGVPLPSPPQTRAKSITFKKSRHLNILRNINLTIEDGEFMVLVGPSGCGKSTLLRLIAGLEELTGGSIWVGDKLVNDLPPKQRDIAMVFQNYALYPHLNVYDNIAFGLRRMGNSQKQSFWLENLAMGITRPLPQGMRYLSEEEKAIAPRVQAVAELLQIEKLLNRLPKELSGGQKQRVALGRAIARSPQVFLMDEPLSNLDAKLRTETRTQIVKLQRQLGITTIYVTHDQTEAMTMGDRIAVINQGQIQQIASPLELYNHPLNLFVAGFIGSPPMNFIPVEIKAPLLLSHPEFRFTLPETWQTALKSYDGTSLLLGIRPEHLTVSPPATKNLPVQIELVEALGNDTYVTAKLASQSVQARIPPDYPLQTGQSVWLSLTPEKIHLFHPDTGEALFP
jgi:multiple sugar transport system ATP-binding protein